MLRATGEQIAFILISGYDYPPTMPESAVTRLTISWSKDTDLALRTHLGARGLKKGALSQFVEDAVRWRLFNQTVDEVRVALVGVPAGELDGMIGEAVKSVRREKNRKRRGRTRE